MRVTEVNEARSSAAAVLRNEPVQARSSARLTGLLDAAAAIIDEIGFERLTTAMVAERAGASIGTVYRYFPDRIAVVEALSARGIQRLIAKISERLAESEVSRLADTSDIVIDELVGMYRSEPGFRAVRFGDSETVDNSSAVVAPRALADGLTRCLAERLGLQRTAALDFGVEIATETTSALIARAFYASPEGDSRFIEAARDLARASLDRV